MRSCRYCGCTDDRACPGGYSWVSADVCSACAPTVVLDAVALTLQRDAYVVAVERGFVELDPMRAAELGLEIAEDT